MPAKDVGGPEGASATPGSSSGAAASAAEGLKLLRAFRAIGSPQTRARLIAMVESEARRNAGIRSL